MIDNWYNSKCKASSHILHQWDSIYLIKFKLLRYETEFNNGFFPYEIPKILIPSMPGTRLCFPMRSHKSFERTSNKNFPSYSSRLAYNQFTLKKLAEIPPICISTF